MTSGPSATSFGSGNGAGIVAATPSELSQLCSVERPQSTPFLSRDTKFCITIIIGGTNVRFCVSPPGNLEPLHTSIKWKELSDEFSPRLEAKGIDFSNAHDVIYPVLAKRMTEFLEALYDPKDGPVPIENLRGLYFSVAGRVHGDEKYHPGISRPLNGIDAEVTTTNTGLNFSNHKLGREIFNALKAENHGFSLSTDKVFVINDARAGQEGEKLHQGYAPSSRIFFHIGGTGEGSDFDVPGFNEIGHRTVVDHKEKKVLVFVGEEIKQLLNPDGTYKDLPEHQSYAENLLAGPWVAIRFVKSLVEKPSVMVALATRIAAKDPSLQGEDPAQSRVDQILGELYELADLKYKDRTRWAINSNSFLLREVNELIFQPNHRANRRALPCNFQVDPLEQASPEKALILLAWARQKSYFKERGVITGEVYRALVAHGCAPTKYILGGGLGEMFNRYSPEDREDAIDLIVDHGNLPPGVFDFSRLSPEARECALAYTTAEAEEKAQAEQQGV